MIVVNNFLEATAIPNEFNSFESHTLTLNWEVRQKSHARLTTDQGQPFAISLPAGTVLQEGMVFVLNEARCLVALIEQPEPVYVLKPDSPKQWAQFAFQIGNRHQDMMITEDELICKQDQAMHLLLEQLAIPHQQAMRPFTPEKVGTGHHVHHSH